MIYFVVVRGINVPANMSGCGASDTLMWEEIQTIKNIGDKVVYQCTETQLTAINEGQLFKIQNSEVVLM